MSIADIRGFIKSLPPARLRDGFIVLVIVLSSLGAFALGRLSATESSTFRIEQRAALGQFLGGGEDVREANIAELFPVPSGAGSVVASKTGAKYHFPWCAGARSIKEENKIWFDSVEQARAAGFTPAGNCKGLK